MKSLFIIAAMLLNSILFVPTDKVAIGVFDFETEIIDYGTIQQNSDGERTFVFTNVGDAPIIISDVKTSCGCTVPSKPESPIMPRETSEIKVKFATSRLGGFSKTLTIISDANEPVKKVRIKGNILKKNA